jgi:hypothetical protein
MEESAAKIKATLRITKSGLPAHSQPPLVPDAFPPPPEHRVTRHGLRTIVQAGVGRGTGREGTDRRRSLPSGGDGGDATARRLERSQRHSLQRQLPTVAAELKTLTLLPSLA